MFSYPSIVGMLQYMQFHTSRLQIGEEELEQIRLKMSHQSPMQEALDLCLQSLDRDFPGFPLQDFDLENHKNLLHDVVFELSTQLNRGVGLATRVAAIQSISYLAGAN